MPIFTKKVNCPLITASKHLFKDVEISFSHEELFIEPSDENHEYTTQIFGNKFEFISEFYTLEGNIVDYIHDIDFNVGIKYCLIHLKLGNNIYKIPYSIQHLATLGRSRIDKFIKKEPLIFQNAECLDLWDCEIYPIDLTGFFTMRSKNVIDKMIYLTKKYGIAFKSGEANKNKVSYDGILEGNLVINPLTSCNFSDKDFFTEINKQLLKTFKNTPVAFKFNGIYYSCDGEFSTESRMEMTNYLRIQRM